MSIVQAKDISKLLSDITLNLLQPVSSIDQWQPNWGLVLTSGKPKSVAHLSKLERVTKIRVFNISEVLKRM